MQGKPSCYELDLCELCCKYPEMCAGCPFIGSPACEVKQTKGEKKVRDTK